MTLTDPSQSLPVEAEQFLARLPALSSDAWADIIERDRGPLFSTLKNLLRGLKLMITPRRFRRRFDAVYSKAAEDRIRRLAEAGALPVRRGWRMIHVTGSALQALCCRADLLEGQFADMYAPFEPYIPANSLRSETNTPTSSGRAGA